MMKFVGRQVELDMLHQFYHAKRAGLMILYGRRRVGKTQLLSHWLKLNRIEYALYWTAPLQNAALQLRGFSQALLRFDRPGRQSLSPGSGFDRWEDALAELAEVASQSRQPFVVVMDEFTNLLKSDPAVPSLFQIAWDHRLSQVPNLRLILTGSLVGLMESQALSARAPLYARATMQYRLRSLPFGHLHEVFPRWSAAERVAAYAVAGGIPGYLELLADAETFPRALVQALTAGSILLTDPSILITDQLRDPMIYESILSAIGSGFHTWREIALMAQVNEASLNYYLQQLLSLELIERRQPVLAPPQGRKGRYYIRDPFLRFYYRFVIPNLSSIQRGEQDAILEAARSDLRAFIGTYIFEELCREWLWAEGALGGLGFMPQQVGAFWAQARGQSVQLDVVAAQPREKRLFIGEAKWGEGQIGRNVLTDLVTRSQRMPQVSEPGWKVQYGLFSRAGFTAATVAAARETEARLVSLPQLEAALIAAARRKPGARTEDIAF
jgi:uncharacterized protein